jgi:uncharacterized cupin superfamily protein
MADDRAQLGLLMDRFLSAVSFDEPERPAYRQLHDLFTAEGRLTRGGPGAPEIWTVEDFIRSRQQAVDAGLLTAFHEVEVGEVTEIFGSVAHRFSTYLKTGMLNGAGLDARGAISTQFIHTHGGWRISSMAWDDERFDLRLPARYQPPPLTTASTPRLPAPAAFLVNDDEAVAMSLQPDEPLTVTRGDPRAFVKELYRDDGVQCGVWEVTPGQFTGENVGFGEHMHVLAGEATVTSEDGSTIRLLPGVRFCAPAGWRGRWEVRQTVRKIYVIYRTS